MSLMTNPVMLRMRSILRATGIAKPLGQILARKNYEERTHKVLRERIRPGDVVWDIGANVGYYTVKFSKWVGPRGCICAFEPSAKNVDRLRAACHDLGNVKSLSMGLSDSNCSAAIEEGSDSLGATSKVVAQPSKTGSSEIRLRTGDDVVACGEAAVPNVIKIDVEGHELSVLYGLRTILAEPGLREILVEVHFALLHENGQPNASRDIESLLRDYGFGLRWIDQSHLLASR